MRTDESDAGATHVIGSRKRQYVRTVLGAGIVAGTAIFAVFVGSPSPPTGPADDTASRVEPAQVWSGGTVRVPQGWYVASATLTPLLSGPVEVLAASTAAMPQGGGRCSQIPQAAIEQLGPDDGFVTLQRGHPIAPNDPVLGQMRSWPTPVRNGVFAECVGNRDSLEWHWVHAQHDKVGYYVLAAFGSRASPSRRAEALAIINSYRMSGPSHQGATPDSISVPHVQGLTLAVARKLLSDVGLGPDLSAGETYRDPSTLAAIVVRQEPPPGTPVPSGSAVRLRTAAFLDRQLCNKLAQLSAVRTGAPTSEQLRRFRDPLEEIRDKALGPLAAAVDAALESLRDYPRRTDRDLAEAIDVIRTHQQACDLPQAWSQ